MTIETSPAPVATRPAPSHKSGASTSAAGVRAKAGAGDAAADAGGAGFMSILGAMDEAVADTPELPGAATDVLSGALPNAQPVPAPFDASTLLQQNPQIAAAQGLQITQATQAMPLASAAISSATSSAPGALAQGPVAAASLAQPAVLAVLPPTGALPDAATQPTPAPASAPNAGETAAKSAVLAAAGKAAPELPGGAESATQGLQHAFTRAKVGKDSLQTSADSSSPASSATSSLADRAEPNKFLAAMEQARAPAGARSPEPVLAPLLFKQEKTTPERSGSGKGSLGSEPTYSATALGVSNTDTAQSGAAAPVLAPEMQVAEQVSYWVAHNVQNAELTLDGLGQSPVQVNISLQGNEAQISFRTDEAATREVLQNAGVHLKELLQNEGLVLTGVSVGNTGSGNADGSERRARPNVRQTAIAPLQVGSDPSGPRPRSAGLGGAGRSVDLFV